MGGDAQGADPADENPAAAGPPQPGAAGGRRGLGAAQRARLERIFGDVLHERSGDEAAAGGRGESDSDAFLRANIPPHHG